MIFFGVIGLTVACGQTTSNKLSSDQKKVLHLYASTYLLADYQQLYYLSEDSLTPFLELPLTPDDFKLSSIDLMPSTSQQYLDTLFSSQELQVWSKQIEDYRPMTWNINIFPEGVTIIRKEEIPKYLNKTDIPPPGQDPVFIHYISPPFMYENKSALMYERRWSSGANVKIYYLYYVNNNGQWELEQRGQLNTGY